MCAKETSTIVMKDHESFVCVHCGHPANSLFKKFSKEVLKLSICLNCSNCVDPYAEMDSMLIGLDILLQRNEAFRHVIFNTSMSNSFWKVIIILIFCDSYKKWIEYKSNQSISSPSNQKFFELEWNFYLMFSEAFIQLILYLSTIILCLRIYLMIWHKPEYGRINSIFLWKCLLLSSFGKVAGLMIIVWNPNFKELYHLSLTFFVMLCNARTIRSICGIRFESVMCIILASAISSNLMPFPLLFSSQV